MGCHLRIVRSHFKGKTYLFRWPRTKAMNAVRERIRMITNWRRWTRMRDIREVIDERRARATDEAIQRVDTDARGEYTRVIRTHQPRRRLRSHRARSRENQDNRRAQEPDTGRSQFTHGKKKSVTPSNARVLLQRLK